MNSTQIVDAIEAQIGITGQPSRLREAIERAMVDLFGTPPIVAAEKAERLEPAVRRIICDRQAQADEDGDLPYICLNSFSDRLVQGYCHIERAEQPEIANIKKRRLQVDPILSRIRGLTFDEFELFGSRILRELGAGSSTVTSHSDDQGIDFYGMLTLGTLFSFPAPFMKLAHNIELHFIGQAKHYPTRTVGPATVRELVGAMTLARYRVFSNDRDPYGGFGLIALNPVVSMLFTTGAFSRGALQLAKKAGVLTCSGQQLALFLADRNVGFRVHDGRPEFENGAFAAWLNS